MNAIVQTAALPAATITEAPASEVVAFLQMIERAARDPSINIDKLERLLEMRERQNARVAEQEFNAAMSAAQAEMEPIRADSTNEQTRSRYASYAALDRAVRPVYTSHGFGLTFDTGEADAPERVRIICDVCHIGGHVRRYHIDMPVDGKGAKGGDVMTKTHATGSGVSYGMRYLLRMIFNLPVCYDDDGNAASGRRRAPRSRPAPPSPFQEETDAEQDTKRREVELSQDFITLRDELDRLTSIQAIVQWGTDNADRAAKQPEGRRNLLRTLYRNRLAEIRSRH